MCVCVCVCVCVHAHTLGCIQLFVTPMECRPLGPSVHRIFQARILEWTALFYSKASSLPDPGIEPTSLVSSALADRFFTTASPAKHYQ